MSLPKKVYHAIMDQCRTLAPRLQTRFRRIGEWRAIYQKRNLYKDVIWTCEQKKEFDAFWKENYGKKISPRWHKLFQSFNGVFRVDYFPDVLCTTKLEQKLNDYEYCKIFSDKSLSELLFSDASLNVRTPYTLLGRDAQKFYDGKRRWISSAQAISIFSELGEAIIKPTVGTCGGKLVRRIIMAQGVDMLTGESAQSIFKKYAKNFIVQERIVPHPIYAALYADAINTIRVTTYFTPTGVKHVPHSMRIGVGGQIADNTHCGGLLLGVEDDGTCFPEAYQMTTNATLDRHPDTKTVFAGYHLPFVQEITDVAQKLHTRLPNVGMVSWDMAVNDKGEIIVIEANFMDFDAEQSQLSQGKPMFGEDTKYMINLLRRGGGSNKT